MRTSTAHGNFQTPAGLQDRHQLAALDPWQCHASLVDHAPGWPGRGVNGNGRTCAAESAGGPFWCRGRHANPKTAFLACRPEKQRKLNPQPEGGTAHETRGLATSITSKSNLKLILNTYFGQEGGSTGSAIASFGPKIGPRLVDLLGTQQQNRTAHRFHLLGTCIMRI